MQMKLEDVQNITVVGGAGLMGHGIALEFATGGYQVCINDVSEEALAGAVERIRASLGAVANAGAISKDAVDAALARITPEASLEKAGRGADVVIEAVFESIDVKRTVFAALDSICPDHTVLLSNTSSLLPSAIAAAANRADRVAVAHHFNPPHLLPVVEIVRGPETSDETADLAMALFRRIGKRPALVRKEVPGFVGNRLQAALIREALAIVQNGVAAPEDVDTVVKYGFGRRLAAAGPYEVFELNGWDLIATVMSTLFPDIDGSKEIPDVLRERVERGELGVKTGEGFYTWTPDSAEALRLRVASALMQMSAWDRAGGD